MYERIKMQDIPVYLSMLYFTARTVKTTMDKGNQFFNNKLPLPSAKMQGN